MLLTRHDSEEAASGTDDSVPWPLSLFGDALVFEKRAVRRSHVLDQGSLVTNADREALRRHRGVVDRDTAGVPADNDLAVYEAMNGAGGRPTSHTEAPDTLAPSDA